MKPFTLLLFALFLFNTSSMAYASPGSKLAQEIKHLLRKNLPRKALELFPKKPTPNYETWLMLKALIYQSLFKKYQELKNYYVALEAINSLDKASTNPQSKAIFKKMLNNLNEHKKEFDALQKKKQNKQELESQILEKDNQFKSLKTKYLRIKRKLRLTKKLLRDAENHYTRENSQQREEIGMLKERIRTTEKELEEITNERDRSIEKIFKLQKDLDSANKEIKVLKQRIDKLQAKNEILVDQNNNLEKIMYNDKHGPFWFVSIGYKTQLSFSSENIKGRANYQTALLLTLADIEFGFKNNNSSTNQARMGGGGHLNIYSYKRNSLDVLLLGGGFLGLISWRYFEIVFKTGVSFGMIPDTVNTFSLSIPLELSLRIRIPFNYHGSMKICFDGGYRIGVLNPNYGSLHFGPYVGLTLLLELKT